MKAQIDDATYIINYRYISDAKSRMLLEEKGSEWDSKKLGLAPRKVISFFDGKSSSIIFEEDRLGHPSSHLQSKAEHFSGNMVWLYPVNLAYRPFYAVVGLVDAKRLELTTETTVIGGAATIGLQYNGGRIWIDPTKDCLPVRYSVEGTNIDIDYRRDSNLIWVLQSWSVSVENSDGKPLMTEKAKVLKSSINKPVPDSEFDLKLPPGIGLTMAMKPTSCGKTAASALFCRMNLMARIMKNC